MSEPIPPQRPQQPSQPPPPAPPGTYPGYQTPPPPNWNQAGGWQPGQPPPPKKSSNGVVIALAIVAGLLVLGLIGSVVARSDTSEPLDEDLANRLEELSESRLEEPEELVRLGELTDDEVVDKLSAELERDDTALLTPSEGRCIAEELVTRLGVARSLELTADDFDRGLPRSEADAVADSYIGCLDLQDYFVRIFETDPGTAGLPRFYVDCLVDELGTETIRDQLAGAFANEEVTDAELDQLGAEAGEACIASFTPEQLDELAAS